MRSDFNQSNDKNNLISTGTSNHLSLVALAAEAEHIKANDDDCS